MTNQLHLAESANVIATDGYTLAGLDRRFAAFMRRTSARYRRDRRRGIMTIDYIIGIALIAIVYMGATGIVPEYRTRGYQSNTQSDASALGTSLESYFTDNGQYPTALTLSGQSVQVGTAELGATISPGNTIVAYTASGESMKFCIQHTSGSVKDAYSVYSSAPDATFSSRTGVVSSNKDWKGANGTCPTTL
jgi:type II secretory pathway pseudopilin PulG